MDLFLTYITDTPTSSGPRLGNTYVAFFNNNRKWAPQLKYCNLRIYTTQRKEQSLLLFVEAAEGSRPHGIECSTCRKAAQGIWVRALITGRDTSYHLYSRLILVAHILFKKTGYILGITEKTYVHV